MDPFVAEIRIFPFNFAPVGWATCDGQLLPISQNTALFSLLGTYYGGDGKTTFALPNLQGRVPVHQGQGPGLADYALGQEGGTPTVTLLQSEMPAHSHGLSASGGAADEEGLKNPANAAPGAVQATAALYGPLSSNIGAMAPEALAVAGGAAPHNNVQPSLTLTFCIAMQGVYPPRG